MTPKLRSLRHLLIVIGLLVLAGALGVALDSATGYNRRLCLDIAFHASLALGLLLVLGLTGQFSLGHAGFLAIGAYTGAVVCGKAEFLAPQIAFWHQTCGLSLAVTGELVRAGGCVAGGFAAMLAAWLVGMPTLRLRGDYLAIATLGFGEILSVLITNSKYLGGNTGLSIPGMQREWIGQAGPNNPLAQNWSLWLQAQNIALPGAWVLILLVMSIIFVRNLKSSTTGRAMLAIREDWLAAETVGIPTTRYKVAAFVLGGALAGLAGGLYAHHQYLTPDSFRFMFSVELVTMVILGGQGSITGTVLAAAGLTLLPQILRTSSTLQHLAGTLGMETSAWNTFIDKWRIIIYAVLIIVLMIFRPQGLLGHHELNILWAKWRRRAIHDTVRVGVSIPPVMPIAIPNPQPLLIVKGLVMEFGGLRAVDDFNLELEPSSLVGIIGPNGAGKTTVFNALSGIYPVTAGTIKLAGHALTGLQPHHISALGLARTFQNIRLFKNLSVLDQIQIAQHVHHQQGLPAALMRHPAFYREAEQVRTVALDLLAFFNLEAYADQMAGQLCYGDQRRLEIARALATRPKILLLDEPAAGLNPAETRDLMRLIERIQREFSVAILLIEHDMKLVMGICQQLVVLDYGRTIAAGPPASIRQDAKVIAAYLGAVGSSG